ncbi:MAG: hypothetical protein HQL64_03275 [Magnetococcales bacterium]|nr:hypothetical protein [Magnetococcales bacterium]
MKTFEEIIQFAIAHEEEEVTFYQDLAARAPNEDQKSALLAHVEEEAEHRKMLKQMLTSQSLPRGESRHYHAPKEMHLEQLYQPKNEVGKPLTYEDSLLLAVKMEQQSEHLYREMAEHMGSFNKGLAQTLLFLAEQQGKHRSRMEALFDATIKEN